VKTAEKISEQVFDHQLTKLEKKWAGPAVHYTFGTTTGAVYGILAETVPVSRSGHGAEYRSAIWLVADEMMVPALGLSGALPETPASSRIKALASHLVHARPC
jgi:putative membrane protein